MSSYVGEPFEYDVFVSYAHAETETGPKLIRDWSTKVAGRLRDLLATALNPTVEAGSAVKVFLDERYLVSGDPPTVMAEKAKRSALLLVLMSPLYVRRPYCVGELEAFFAQADKDGRSQRHCTVLRVQPLTDTDWPRRLRDEQGKPVLFRDLVDPDTGDLPLGIDDPDAPELNSALRQVFIEIRGKLKELRGQLEARRQLEQAATPPVQPLVYLHAQLADLQEWERTRNELSSRAIVTPDTLFEPSTDDTLHQRERMLRLKEYELCDALLLLRARPDDSMRIEVMAAYKDRQRLYQEKRLNIRWAIVDRVGGELPVAVTFRVPRVVATRPGWTDELMQALGLYSTTDARS